MTPKIILIHSFKGGTGKTLTSINLANLLSSQGKRVLLIESDFTMPAFHSIFSKYKPDIYLNDFLRETSTIIDQFIYPDGDAELGVIFCDDQFRTDDKIHYNDQNWFRAKKNQLHNTFENLNYDYIVFDCQPGPHLFTINLITLANEIILMLRPDIQSIQGTKILLERIYSKSIRINSENTPKFSLLFNQVPQFKDIDEYINRWSNELKYSFEFISEIGTLYYNDITSYHTALQKFVLPKDDPLRTQLATLFSSLSP
jgi:MinD-like ATPase involved in chromosome partitioning or flagellar assembly